MDIKKGIFMVMVGIVFVGTGFLFGYMFGNILYTPAEPEPIAELSLPQTVAEEVSPAPTVPILSPTLPPEQAESNYYLVQSIGNSIYIYEIINDTKSTVKVFDVSLDMFPSEDIKMLENGIKTDTVQEAYSIIENFTS